MKGRRFSLPLKFAVASAIIFLAVLFIIGYICKALETGDYFRIQDVVTGEGGKELAYLRGRNIFSLRLESEAENLLSSFPECKKIRLVRILPDRIAVDFIKRQPFAYVKLYKYFAVDEEGVFFQAPLQPEREGLPLIFGLETKIFGPKPGKRYNNRELSAALNIIREAKKNRALQDYKIIKINAASLLDISVWIDVSLPAAPPIKQKEGLSRRSDAGACGRPSVGAPLEVKLAAENIKEKIGILAGIFTQEKSALGNIKYIDLRFKEPVIKFNAQ